MGWYCWRSVWLSFWHNCLRPFLLKTSSYSKCSSNSPLWPPPTPLHLPLPTPPTLLPPLYLCLVSREKNKAPYVLVLENTWINVLFLCKKCATSSVFICDFCSLPISPSLMSDILLATRLGCLSWRVFTPRFNKSRDFYVGPPSWSACGTASSPWTRPMSKGIGC